ncbi:MAG TPA: hypothetical protein VKV15_13190 [Bryobacteraceae bacterium]|nr:hypothetical protein [Bryobacteraceae bacterium]
MPIEPQRATQFSAESPESAPPPRRPWYRKLLGLIFVLICFEVGVFLLVFPWMQFWDTNSLAARWPWLAAFWSNPFFRGALSGLGLANIYISFLEVLRLVRVSAQQQTK